MTRKQIIQTPIFLLTIVMGVIVGFALFMIGMVPLMIKPSLIDGPKDKIIAKVSREFMRAMMRRNGNGAKVVA